MCVFCWTEQRLGLIEKDIHTALGKSRPFKELEPMSHRPIIPEKFRAGNFLRVSRKKGNLTHPENQWLVPVPRKCHLPPGRPWPCPSVSLSLPHFFLPQTWNVLCLMIYGMHLALCGWPSPQSRGHGGTGAYWNPRKREILIVLGGLLSSVGRTWNMLLPAYTQYITEPNTLVLTKSHGLLLQFWCHPHLDSTYLSYDCLCGNYYSTTSS